LIGLGIGIPLAIAEFALGVYLIRAMLAAADKPGMSPTVIPVVILVGVAMLLYAANPEQLAPLGDLAGVGLGGLVGLLVGSRTGGSNPETPPVPVGGHEKEESVDDEELIPDPHLTQPVDSTEGIAPEDVVVPDDIEAIGVEPELADEILGEKDA
jgi:hypothetical protein